MQGGLQARAADLRVCRRVSAALQGRPATLQVVACDPTGRSLQTVTPGLQGVKTSPANLQVPLEPALPGLVALTGLICRV